MHCKIVQNDLKVQEFMAKLNEDQIGLEGIDFSMGDDGPKWRNKWMKMWSSSIHQQPGRLSN